MLESYAGHHAEAVQIARRMETGAPGYTWPIQVWGYVTARAGMRAEAQAALAQLKGMPNSEGAQAVVETALGNTDRAFTLLEDAIARRDEYVSDLSVDPLFDPLRNDPRMARLLGKMRLPG